MMSCRVCRARKVRCDGRPDGCRNCERLQLECVADDGSKRRGVSTSLSSSVSMRKLRTYRSCQSCRLSKTKCDGDRPKCSRCEAKLVQCVYNGDAAPRWTRNLDKSKRMSMVDEEEAQGKGGSETERDETAVTEVVQTAPVSSDGNDRNASVQEASLECSDQFHDKPSILSDAKSMAVAASRSLSDSKDLLASHSLAWLVSPSLPTRGSNLRRVVEQYFANVHPLRCFAFVHKPSFMRQLDNGLSSDDESALLHIICAHGAKFLAMTEAQEDHGAPPLLQDAGNEWAKRAEYLMLANFGKISVQRLMTAILLHDFHFRLGEYGQALMISGLAVRMAHALKINTEYDPDILCTQVDTAAPSVASRESRRRLMWACYVLDAWAGSGVDQLTLLRENDIKIQLPSNERNFGLRIPSVTETLGVGHVLQFLPPAIVPRRPAANMGIMAYYIRVVALWKRIVHYVNNLHATSPPPWKPDSLFAALEADLHLWRQELPDFVDYTTETIYARLDSNQLGALVLMHCTYHHNYLELYKLTMPDLFKLPKPLAFPLEHQDFLQTAQADCYYHARQIAHILAEAAENGSRLLSDSLLPFFVYDSSRLMLYYVARLLDPDRPDAEAKMRDAVKAVGSNSRVLRMMSALFPIAQSLSATIERWLSKIQFQQSVVHGDVLKSIKSDNQLRANRAVLSDGMNNTRDPTTSSDFVLPSLLLPSLAHPTARDNSSAGVEADEPRAVSKAIAARNTSSTSSFSTQNPHAGGQASWDGTSVAYPRLNLSQEVPLKPSLQHERPVLNPHPHGKTIPGKSMCDALDLDDLQNFLSWDMYGIIEMGGSVSNEDMDDSVSQSWTGAI
ncbi:hypothetical protein E4U60_005289 [Claviceps pazoutovae]|uniref:Zn(2)-C6 fungal-type domain-containing protein n=1 Tax=Claviceps pazoutovae TaxID=1649127 RepID=A0A9P7SIZ5_9HYPO|nr:hypothetical protein E4U60_005289 [Claviceps pazoutovae]